MRKRKRERERGWRRHRSDERMRLEQSTSRRARAAGKHGLFESRHELGGTSRDVLIQLFSGIRIRIATI